MKVFSFCIYGTERNYYEGLLENIQIIREYFPDFEIYVYKGICDPSWVFENCKIIETEKEGAINMLYRYLPLTFADIGFVRDADSRVYERDRWCISEFLKSDKLYHLVRDHYYHKEPIMGGIFGWKKPINIDLGLDATISYSQDMTYLKDHLYPLIKKDSLVHTNNHAFFGEHVELIAIPHNDNYDFIGNVIWDNKPKFEYSVGNIIEQLVFLKGQDQHIIMSYLGNSIDPKQLPYHARSNIFNLIYIANFYVKNIERCQYWLSQFEFAEMNQNIYNNANFLFNILNKKVVASFDITREPLENEVVIVYGNYPDWHHALPYSSKILRHASLFFSIRHDVVEYDPSWEDISTIYVLNLEDRADRFSNTLLSLCSVKAPLHRIYHYKAKKDGLPPYVGATKNHVDVIKHFVESSKEKCLIIEDDIVFIDDHKCVWDSLRTLSSRKYDYMLCFLAISRIGERRPLDDLLSISKQECTTSSAYFLQKSTAASVLEVATEGLVLMQSTGDHHKHCIDRYWSKLSDIYFFKKKLAYQTPSYSSITQKVNFFLD